MKALPETFDVRIRQIDVKSWDSPVATHFGIRRLPTLWLYEGQERISTDVREILTRYAD